jgi:hypothetical protein
MKLAYRIGREDHSAFQWHHFWRSAAAWRNYAVVFLLGVSLVSYTLYDRGLEFQTAVSYLAGYILLMVLIFAVTSYLTLTSGIKRMIPPGDNNGVVGDHCLVVDDAGIWEQAGPVETKVKWDVVRKLSVGEDHAFIYFAPSRAFIVPKRAFTNESEFNGFVRDCISRLP